MLPRHDVEADLDALRLGTPLLKLVGISKVKVAQDLLLQTPVDHLSYAGRGTRKRPDFRRRCLEGKWRATPCTGTRTACNFCIELSIIAWSGTNFLMGNPAVGRALSAEPFNRTGGRHPCSFLLWKADRQVECQVHTLCSRTCVVIAI